LGKSTAKKLKERKRSDGAKRESPTIAYNLLRHVRTSEKGKDVQRPPLSDKKKKRVRGTTDLDV